jgi:hypothetical protein
MEILQEYDEVKFYTGCLQWYTLISSYFQEVMNKDIAYLLKNIIHTTHQV